MVYIILVLLLCFCFYISDVNLISIFALNGAVIGYIFVFVLPIWVHLKCIWYDRSGGRIQDNEDWNSVVKPNGCG